MGLGSPADLLPAERAGTGLGLYQAVIGGCVLVTGVWAGLAWDGSGHIPLIVSGVIIGLLAAGPLAAGQDWTGRTSPSSDPARRLTRHTIWAVPS